MHDCEVFVKTGIAFGDAQAALRHIGKEMLRAGVVEVSYPHALIRRESEFPTGIMLESHGVAIPHCEAVHAIKPEFISFARMKRSDFLRPMVMSQ